MRRPRTTRIVLSLAFMISALNGRAWAQDVDIEPGQQVTIGNASGGQVQIIARDDGQTTINNVNPVHLDLQSDLGACTNLSPCAVTLNPNFGEGIQIELKTFVTGGLDQLRHATAQGNGTTDFSVVGPPRLFRAELVGGVTISGVLDADVEGASTIKVTLAVTELNPNQTIAQETVFHFGCESGSNSVDRIIGALGSPLSVFALDSCENEIDSEDFARLEFAVRGGKDYRVSFTATCDSLADTGAFDFGSEADCDFVVSRGSLQLTLEPDLVGLIEMLSDDIAAHDANLATHDARLADHEISEEQRFRILLDKIERNFGALLESIRLLLTPTGLRSTDIPACNGEPCSFPNGANGNSNGSDTGGGNVRAGQRR